MMGFMKEMMQVESIITMSDILRRYGNRVVMSAMNPISKILRNQPVQSLKK